MEIPMLDKEEFAIASKLYSKAFKIEKADRQERFKELLEYYNGITGFGETEPNAIMHHSLEQIGVLLCYCVTVLLCYCVTVLLCYCVTVLLCYCVTVLLC